MDERRGRVTSRTTESLADPRPSASASSGPSRRGRHAVESGRTCAARLGRIRTTRRLGRPLEGDAARDRVRHGRPQRAGRGFEDEERPRRRPVGRA